MERRGVGRARAGGQTQEVTEGQRDGTSGRAGLLWQCGYANKLEPVVGGCGSVRKKTEWERWVNVMYASVCACV
jgi:hypothetical protein